MASTSSLVATGTRQLGIAVRVLLALTVITGVLYPLLVLGIGRVIAPDRADGSLVTDGTGRVVGSALLGQDFAGDEWFAGRPSAGGYDAMASGGSNLATGNPDQIIALAERRQQLATANNIEPEQVPADAITASASGLDPDISPAYALLQVDRVAAARNLPVEQVRALVEEHVSRPWLGFVGQDRVNVLELNLALDAAARTAAG